MNSGVISGFFSVAVGIYVWWTITKAAWKEANSFMGNPMKALAVTVIVAPIVGVIATTVIGMILS